MTSIFILKENKPTPKDLAGVLGRSFSLWQETEAFVKATYPAAITEWNFLSIKYGWNFRIKDKRRVIIYMQPQSKYFMASFVFGQKATDAIMKSGISDPIKLELTNAKVYAEGRGIRIEVKNKKIMNDLKELVKIKCSF